MVLLVPHPKLPVRISSLENGLRVLTSVHRAAPLVSVWMHYGVGSGDEGPGERGLAHFLEHMMFKGTARLPKGEIDRLTHKSGGHNNAYTMCDATAYDFGLPAESLDLALRIEADRMENLRIDPSEFEAERGVILEEISTAQDSPEGRLQERVDTLTFPNHPYGHPILGRRTDVEAFTPSGLESFYSRWYTPANATLVIAGDIDEEACLARVHELFGAIAARETAERSVPPAPAGRPAREILREPVEVPRLLLHFPSVAVSDPHEVPLECAATLLASGRSSRLYRRLVNEGLLAHVRADSETRRGTGVFWIDAEAHPGADLAAIEEALFSELANLAADGPADRELERVRHSLEAGRIYRTETCADSAEDLGDAASVRALDAFGDYPERLASMTAKDVAEAAADVLDRDRAVLAWSTPEGGDSGPTPDGVGAAGGSR